MYHTVLGVLTYTQQETGHLAGCEHLYLLDLESFDSFASFCLYVVFNSTKSNFYPANCFDQQVVFKADQNQVEY